MASLNCTTSRGSLKQQARAQRAAQRCPSAAMRPRSNMCPSLHTSMQQHIARASASDGPDPSVSMEEMFAAELATRAAAEAKQAEVAAAAVFDGAALLALLR